MAEKNEPKKTAPTKLVALIRIEGMVGVKPNAHETLDRLRLRRKYACVLIDASRKEVEKMIHAVQFHIAFGDIDKETLIKLIHARGKAAEGDKKKIKMSPEEVAEGLLKGKKLADFGLKPFFRLHPPRKGIKSKLQYPKGVLGNHGKNISKLIERML